MTPHVKICGIRRQEDAELACEFGATALGFVLWPGSPRFIEPQDARAIVATLPPFVTAVGVFVNQAPAHVAAVADLIKLGAVQLHGDEPVEAYAASGLRVIKAVPVVDAAAVGNACLELPRAATILLDASDPVRRGGTGRTIDWRIAAAAARLRPVILSGGLTAANVAEAIARVRPYAIDVSSGVESAPGVKDSARMRALFTALPAAPVQQ